MWPEFCIAEEVFDLYKEKHCQPPTLELSEKEFKKRCDELWALDDLLEYLKENWYFEEDPGEIIADYIFDANYRAEKYKDISPMGAVYKVAAETAENIIHCFESLTCEGELI